tara:strand:- start:8026 stop:9831 length:1806 start_codon:yes stop_codon:yes gene_type:complete
MRLVFDIETNGIDFSTGDILPQVTDLWCIVARDIDDPEGYHNKHLEWNCKSPTGELEALLKKLEEADELIGHNIIQFDIPALKKLCNFNPNGRITDTLVWSRVNYPDRPGGHSLKSWGERTGTHKGEFTDFTEYSKKMLQYCRDDVKSNIAVYRRLEKEGSQSNALELEHRIADIIARQEQRGCYFRKSDAEGLIHDWDERINDIDVNIRAACDYSITPGRVISKPYKINGEPTVQCLKALGEVGLRSDQIEGPWCSIGYTKPDLGSKQQQKELLLGLGWKPDEHTPTGQPKLNESIKQVGMIGEELHERNVLSHRLSQVKGLVNLVDEDSRIHGGANPCGTPTGRMRHTRIVNIPRANSPYGAEIRSLFGAPKGKVFLGYDASGLELRMLAHYVGSEELNQKVLTDKKSEDFHSLAAQVAVVEVAQREVQDILDVRDTGKTVVYALIYGAKDYRLGTIIGGGKKEGQKIRSLLFSKIPGLKELTTKAERAAKKGYLLGLDGRKLHMRPNAPPLNTLLQGGGAVFMKTSTAYLDEYTRDIQEHTFKVLDMHDEGQWECYSSDVPFLTKSIHRSFDSTTALYELRCPQQAEVSVGESWVETH